MIRFKEVIGFAVLVVVVSLIGAKSSLASDDIGKVLSELTYHYNPPEFSVCANGTVECKEVGKKDEFTLIHADGGKSCPAGYYFIANSKRSYIEPVIAPTCDPSLLIGFAKTGRAIELSMFDKVVGKVPLDH